MNLSVSQKIRSVVAPNRTKTSSLEGIIITFCSWKPIAAKVSAGALGHRRSEGAAGEPVLSQKSAPFSPRGASGVDEVGDVLKWYFGIGVLAHEFS